MYYYLLLAGLHQGFRQITPAEPEEHHPVALPRQYLIGLNCGPAGLESVDIESQVLHTLVSADEDVLAPLDRSQDRRDFV